MKAQLVIAFLIVAIAVSGSKKTMYPQQLTNEQPVVSTLAGDSMRVCFQGKPLQKNFHFPEDIAFIRWVQ